MTTQLKNLNLGELKTLYANNNDFADAVYGEAQDNNSFWLEEQSKEMLGKNRGYKYHNNYASFYLRITDAERFVADLPETCKDHLPQDKTELYDRAKNLLDKWENMTYDEQDANEGIFTELETTATELLQAIEDTLHEFENITDEDIEQALQKIAEDCSYMSDWELQDNGTNIIEYIAKIYK